MITSRAIISITQDTQIINDIVNSTKEAVKQSVEMKADLAATAKAAALQSANTKLANLGLTADEIAALGVK